VLKENSDYIIENYSWEKIASNFENDVFVIKDLSGSIESGGEFKISGNITNNNFASVYSGFFIRGLASNTVRNVNFLNNTMTNIS
jgi:hypothetical protein